MSRRGSLMMAMLAVVALGGCAETKPGIPLGRAQPATPVTIAAPDGSGLVPMSQWPAACDLLPEPVVRAVLPAATLVEMKRVTPAAAGGGAGNGSVLPGDAECRILVDFAEAKDVVPGPRGGRMDLTVTMAGTPELARESHEESVGAFAPQERTACPPELAATAGLDDCTATKSEWIFRKHGVAGRLRGVAPVLNKNVRFDGQRDDASTDEIWHGAVGAEFLRAIAARLP